MADELSKVFQFLQGRAADAKGALDGDDLVKGISGVLHQRLVIKTDRAFPVFVVVDAD